MIACDQGRQIGVQAIAEKGGNPSSGRRRSSLVSPTLRARNDVLG
jgi:hypothetical protein